jgi:hypothetical protein
MSSNRWNIWTGKFSGPEENALCAKSASSLKASLNAPRNVTRAFALYLRLGDPDANANFLTGWNFIGLT